MPEEISRPEPWLRGVLPGVEPVIGHLLRSSQQIREDLAAAIPPQSPAGFHLKHLAGSTDRLCTYLEGRQLSRRQMDALAGEHEPGGSAATWLAAIDQALDRYEEIIRRLTPEQFGEIRHVGRQRLETTAIGLAIHIVEHGQRHTGQAITCRKLTKS
ncbi:MAG TPA: DinB family protein [Bryobacteraceae bacterium]|jgi:hypothetical protein|nr:DinB family protein [Bryobacteraceae bacterium]